MTTTKPKSLVNGLLLRVLFLMVAKKVPNIPRAGIMATSAAMWYPLGGRVVAAEIVNVVVALVPGVIV
jgi:hypothetical protein